MRQLGLNGNEAAKALGLTAGAFSAWTHGRVASARGATLGALEALRMLEACWGAERTAEFVRGSTPEQWMVALATLAASVKEG
jgi:hypothetical protein